MSPITIQLFGHIRIMLPGAATPLKLQLGSQALLAYLVIRPGTHYSRDQIIDSFWGAQEEKSARNCLNSALWRLRRHMEGASQERGAYLITSDEGAIGFNWASDYWLDVEHFERTLEPLLRKPVAAIQPHEVHQIEETLQLYRDELLLDLYDDWAIRARERFRRLHLNSLEYLMRYHSDHQQIEQGLAYGEQILEKDPLREEIYQRLMQLHLTNGQRSLALQEYERCATIVHEELGVPPLPATQALYHQIIARQSPTVGNTVPSFAPSSRRTPSSATMAQLQVVIHHIDEAYAHLAQAVTAIHACLANHNPPS